jgi:GT2 family glycosyltransferase
MAASLPTFASGWRIIAMSQPAPRVAIIVLNWNGLNDTTACLESLARLDYPSYEVVLVDNGSSDGSPAILRRQFPTLTILETGANLGYAGGNNVGLRYACERRADYALLLNNDTELDAAFLRILVDVCEADPAIGIAGPTIYYHAQPDIVWSAGGRIHWRNADTTMEGIGEVDQGQFGKSPRPMDFVTGCALLIRREVIDRIGLLDERFFLYYEETEWCIRATKAGYTIVHAPLSKVWHKISIQKQEVTPYIVYYSGRNRLLFLRASGRAWWRVLSLILFFHLRTAFSWSVFARHASKRHLRKALLRSAYDFLTGRFGPAPKSIFANTGAQPI